jgi:hypothetical protein
LLVKIAQCALDRAAHRKSQDDFFQGPVNRHGRFFRRCISDF